MPDSPPAPVDHFDLDTAPAILADLASNTMPWIELAERLQRFVQLANSNHLSSIDSRATVRLLDKVLRHVEQYHQVVLQRLDQDLYRTLR